MRIHHVGVGPQLAHALFRLPTVRLDGELSGRRSDVAHMLGRVGLRELVLTIEHEPSEHETLGVW